MMIASRMIALDIFGATLNGQRLLEDALDENKNFAALDKRDRGFVHLLVLTALRRLGQIDAILKLRLAQEIKPAAHKVRDALRLATCQILFLEVPAYAAVSSAVEMTRAVNFESHCKFVNAVLQNIGRTPEAHQDI